MTSRPSTAAPILAVLAIVLVMLLAAYVGGYFLAGEYWEMGNTRCIVRTYRHQWQTRVFHPATYMESLLTGWQVETSARDSSNP